MIDNGFIVSGKSRESIDSSGLAPAKMRASSRLGFEPEHRNARFLQEC